MKRVDIPGLEQGCAQLVMGSMMLSDERMAYSAGLLDAYFGIGGNTIDTAHVYGPSGARAIGQWMRERGNRADLVLIGKGAHHDENGPRVTQEAMERDLADTFERMQTDYVDIFMLHRDDPARPVGEIVEALNAQLEAGRCLALGASNWTARRIQEANDYAAAHGLTGFACNSPNLSLAKPNEPRWPGCISVDDDYAAWHARTQLPLLSWSSQAGGFFTGRFSPERRDNAEAVRVYYSDANWERLDRARFLAARKGVDANQIALAFVLRQPFPTCALIGPNETSELLSSAGALSVSLTPAEMRWLDLTDAELHDGE
ncbi:aldo/keto reductase [Cohnella sp. REN36]|uniref:aldo/keto reductase n=1 Tax=Cohnella sp. REN36 TaxID=2887347 RepID=UPI001D156C56|nr:aldo/keto reductase [Cohnella sp. REN36]MCC3375084.1 aldo/keto reductase [Cohnella sp. REN36]